MRFVNEVLPEEVFQFNLELMNKVRNNTKVIIDQNKIDDTGNEKTYRRKIKKKIFEN